MPSSFQAEHLNPTVLPEVVVEGERRRDLTDIQNRERDRVAEGPVLVGVSSENLFRALLLFGEGSDDVQPACQQPFAGNRSAKLSQQERVRFRFDVVRNETRPLVRRELTCDDDRAWVIGIVRIE